MAAVPTWAPAALAGSSASTSKGAASGMAVAPSLALAGSDTTAGAVLPAGVPDGLDTSTLGGVACAAVAAFVASTGAGELAVKLAAGVLAELAAGAWLTSTVGAGAAAPPG